MRVVSWLIGFILGCNGKPNTSNNCFCSLLTFLIGLEKTDYQIFSLLHHDERNVANSLFHYLEVNPVSLCNWRIQNLSWLFGHAYGSAASTWMCKFLPKPCWSQKLSWHFCRSRDRRPTWRITYAQFTTVSRIYAKHVLLSVDSWEPTEIQRSSLQVVPVLWFVRVSRSEPSLLGS